MTIEAPRPRDALALAFLAAAILLALQIRLHNLASPFAFGFDGWLGSFYAASARNFDRIGFVDLRFAPHPFSGPLRFGEESPYLNRPPLLANVTGLAFRTLGESEWAARLFPAACALLSVGLFFQVVARSSNRRVAGVGALAFAALPMTGIYGGLVVVEPVYVAAILATWLAYLRYRETGRTRDLTLLAALFAAAAFVDWFAAFGGFAIAVHASLARPRARWRAVPVLALAGAAGAGLVLAHRAWASPGSLPDLFHAALARASTTRMEWPPTAFSWVEWGAQQAKYLARLFRPLGVFLGAAGPLMAWVSGREDLRRGAVHAGLLALVGALPLVCFPSGSMDQDYWSYPLSLGIAYGVALAAAGGFALADRLRARALRRAVQGATIAVLAVFALSAQRTTWRALAEEHDDRTLRDIAREIAAVTEFEGGILTPEGDTSVWMPVSYYADRAVILAVDSLDRIEELRRRPPRPSAPPRYVAFTTAPSGFSAPLAAELSARFPAYRGDRVVVFDLDHDRK